MWTDAAVLCGVLGALGGAVLVALEFKRNDKPAYRVVLKLSGKLKVHHCKSESEAMDWLAQYPLGFPDGDIQIYEGNRCIAVRPQLKREEGHHIIGGTI